MKLALINGSRSQLQWRTHLLCLSAALLFFVPWASAQTDTILSPIGGTGGSRFAARCPQGQHLTGFELRIGDDVDAIRPICVTAYGPAEAGPLEPSPSRFGGSGGGADIQLLCPRDNPIVVGMYVRAEGVRTISVNNIHLFCGIAAAAQTRSQYPSVVHDGPNAKPDEGLFGLGTHYVSSTTGTQHCPAGLVAVGINGRSGIYLDALGLICGAPSLTPKTAPAKDNVVKSQGRVILEGGTSPRPQISKCEAAQRARARNSPAAPGLEAQCLAIVKDLAARGEAIANQDPLAIALRNQQSAGLARRGFDIGMAAAEGHTEPGPGKDSIQKSLSSPAEQEGFNAAVLFSLARNRNKKLAATGAAIVEADPTVAASRNAERDAFFRLGFDIATGIFGDPALGALGNTLTGPGSLGIRARLNAEGQRGFDASARLHLTRNYRSASGPSITIRESVGTDPVTVYTRGMTQMTVNVSWNAGPDYTYCEIYLSVDDGQWSEFARGRDGAKPAAIKLGSSHIFRMMIYEGQAGTPKIIKTLTVKGVL